MTDAPPGRLARFGMALLLAVVALLITVVVIAPIALSSGDLVRWAASTSGLGLTGWWPWLVFVALDAAAGTCVLLSVYCAWRGKGAGAFGVLVWVFALFSAFANFRHGTAPGAAADAWWFFPVMSLLGPGLLEAVTWFVRREAQKGAGIRAGEKPKFGLGRWLPIVGAPRDTYGARRTAQVLGIATVAEAVAIYHALCPDGSLHVVRAIRGRDVAAAQLAADEAAKAARAAARAGAVTVDQLTDAAATNGATRLRAVAATGRPSQATIRAAVANGHPTAPADHSQLAIADAATIRRRWPTGLPDRGAQRLIRSELDWHAGKATNALRAYLAGADLSIPVPSAGSASPASGSGAANGAATP